MVNDEVAPLRLTAPSLPRGGTGVSSCSTHPVGSALRGVTPAPIEHDQNLSPIGEHSIYFIQGEPMRRSALRLLLASLSSYRMAAHSRGLLFRRCQRPCRARSLSCRASIDSAERPKMSGTGQPSRPAYVSICDRWW